MGFGAAVKSCLRKYVSISGRASRAEYWWFILFSILVSIVALGLDAVILGPDAFDAAETGPVGVITSLALLLPTVTVTVRRLHDTSRPGYYILAPIAFAIVAIAIGALIGPTVGQASSILVGLIIVAGLLLSVIWMVLPSVPGDNIYGPNPHGVAP